MCAEPIRDGKAPRDKQQQEAWPPLGSKGQDRRQPGHVKTAWWELELGTRIFVNTQVEVEPCKSNSLGSHQVKVSRHYKGLYAFSPELLSW